MKSIKFKSIQVEGFGSFIHPTKFNLDRKGINIINGMNGAGKTTLFNALYWALYGQNLKGVTASKLPTKKKYRTKNWRGTRVAILFTVDGIPYLVSRHISFKGTTKGLEGGSKLMILEKGEMLADELHKKDMQLFLEDLIGLDSKAFLNSILFGQRMKKFIEANPEDKRKIFESVFDIDFIERAKNVAKEKKSDLESNIKELDIRQDSIDSKIEQLESKLKSDTKILDEFESKKLERISEVKGEIDGENDKLKNLTKELNDLEKNNPVFNKLKYETLDKAMKLSQQSREDEKESKRDIVRKQSRNDSQIEESNAKIEKYNKDILNIKDKCPTCTQSLPKSKIEEAKSNIEKSIETEKEVISQLEKNAESLSKKLIDCDAFISTINQDIDKIDAELSKLEEDKDNYSKVELEKSKLSTNIENCESNLEKLKTRLEKEEQEQPPTIDLKSTKEEISKLDKNYISNESEIKKFQEELDRVKWWISKGFGSSGIRSYIFNSMLTLLNKSMEKYASRLGFKVRFSIDMEKTSKPFLTKCYTIDGVESDYDEFSGGEKARIDVSSAFAMHDLVSSNVDIDILIMDEIFEGLDEQGIEDVGDLIHIKSKGKSLYVITHLTNVDFLNSKHIDIRKEKNNTIIE